MIEVCPAAVKVGTLLTVTATGCGYPGKGVILYFGANGGASTGTWGSTPVGSFETDSAGRVQVAFAVPSVLEPVQSSGGGPTTAGMYRVYSKPTVCSVPVRVD